MTQTSAHTSMENVYLDALLVTRGKFVKQNVITGSMELTANTAVVTVAAE